MKFSAFKEFRGIIETAESVVQYLSTDLKKALNELNIGLTRLSFGENFESFETTVTLAAGEELAIRNQLPGGTIPTARIILRGKSGAESIVDGDTEWTRDFVYLKNTGAGSATVTVAFLR